MIKNSSGLVAIRHYNSNPATVKMEADGTLYSFVPRMSVSLAWVQEKDVDTLLLVKARVCCGKQANKFRMANMMDVSVWETGSRPTPEFLSKFSET